nr:ribonuclease H-like domain-containing protein [Tanacetum cinerariifolium]
MDSLSTQVVSAAKLPILSPNEFDLFKMRIEQYFLMTDYSLWEVILNGDSPTPIRVVDGVLQLVALLRLNTCSSFESLDQIHDRLQKLISQLEILRVSLSQEEINLNQSNSPQLDNDDLKKINVDDTDDLEEMDLKWQVAICHRKGHFARECRSPKDTRRNGAAEPQRRNITVETFTSNALVSQCDGVGSYDWSFQAEEEPTNYALMAFSSLSSSSDNEFSPSPIYDRYQLGNGYHVVPPPYTGTFMQSKPDLVFNNAPTKVETDHPAFNVKLSPSKPNHDLSHTNRPSAPIIKDWVSDSEDASETKAPQNVPSFDQSTKQVKSPRPSVQHVETSIPAATPKPASPKPTSNGKHRNRKACFMCKSLDHLIKDCDYHEKKMAQPTAKNHAHKGNHKQYAQMKFSNPQRHAVPASILTQSMLVPINVVPINAVRPVSTDVPKVKVTRPRQPKPIITKPNLPTRRLINHNPSPKASNSPPRGTAVKALMVNAAKGNPQHALKDKRVIDSGCSRHMTGNMSYLFDFEELNGGYVAFGGNPKGGKIFRKRKIRTGKLDFDDVYFVKELTFNLFSVSQMCDKKNSVLFTNTECLVLSPDFKLPDESQVLLRVPRKSNMYKVNLKNIVPSRDLTCLFAKATLDKSNLWHRRLGYINFKTMNKLVKCNFVRGLPTKVFENNNTCVAYKKGKQHRASCKKKLAEAVHTACYVKNRVLVAKPHNKTPYELLHGRTPSISFMRPFGCPVTILNTLDSLGKFDTKNTDGEAAFDEKEPKFEENKPESEVNVSPSNSAYSCCLATSPNSTNTFSAAGPSNAAASPTQGKSSYDLGAEADFNNLETSIIVSPILTTRVHKDHPVAQIIVVRIEAIRLFLAYASFMGFMVYQMDVKSAFLYGTIKEEVYVCQPLGFKDLDYPDKVYKVVKALYGLHQAPRACPDQTVSGKDSSNPLMADNLPKIVWYSTHHVTLMKSWLVQKQTALGVNTPRSDEDRLELMELTVFLLPSKKGGVEVSAVDLQFWTSVAVKKVNDVTRLQALVDKKKVVITEALIRDTLRLDDAEGIECLPNEEIFAKLGRMGYEKPSTKLTFYKAFFSRQWKFLIHTILQWMSAKRTSWNEFNLSMASVVICLSLGRKFNFSKKQVGDLSTHTTKYTSPTLTQKVFANMRRVGVVSTPDDVVPTVVEEPFIPSPTPPTLPSQPSQDVPSTSQEAKDVAADIVKDVQDADVEDSSYDKGRQAESQAEIYKIDLDHANKIITEVVPAASTTITIVDVLIPAATTAAALTLTAAPSRRTKGVVIRDPKESTTTSKIIHSKAKSKEQAKGKGILVEEPKPLKKQAQIKQDAKYARELKAELNKTIDWDEVIHHVYRKQKEDKFNVAGFKIEYFKGMSYDDIRLIFEKHFDSNVVFLQKTKEQMDEEDSRALKRLNESKEEKAAKKQKLDEEVEELKRHL